MKTFGWVFIVCILAFLIVMMRVEIIRSGRAIGSLHKEVEIKEARKQYLELENARLSGPQTIEQLAKEKLNLRRTPPQHVVVLED